MSANRIRVLLVSMLAVFAISAVASGSAFAAQEHKFFVEKVAVTEPGDGITGVVGTAQLNSTIAGSKVLIECGTNAFSEGKILESGKDSGKISFSGCKLFTILSGVQAEQTKCVVKVPIEFKFKSQLFTGPGGVEEDLFTPSSGTTFVTITIENKGTEVCLFKGAFEAKGEYDASLPEGEVQKVAHRIVFTSTGSKLKLGAEPASFTNELSSVEVSTKKPWYVD